MQAGYLSRGRVEDTPTGAYRLLQARDVNKDGTVQSKSAAKFDPERNPDLYRVSEGDILVVARGQTHKAFLIDVELRNTLASSVFHIVRLDRDSISPGYAAWWLNRPHVQAMIHEQSRGTGIGYIGRQVIEQIPVWLSPFDHQERIASVMALWRRRHSLQSQLDQKRQIMIQALCRQAVLVDKEQA